MPSRPVYPRATRMALIVASVPELVIRTISIERTTSQTSSASSTSSCVGAPKVVPHRPFQGFHYLRMGVAEDQGTVTHDVVHVGVTVHVEDARALPAPHKHGISTDRAEGADRTIDASGETMHRPLHQACGAVHRQLRPGVYALSTAIQ